MKNSPNRFRLPVQKLGWWADFKIKARLKAAAKARDTEERKFGWGGLLAPQYAMVTMCAAIMVTGVFGYTWAPNYVYQSPSIVKGDRLYDWKRSQETTRLAALSLPEEKAEYYVALSDRRLTEAQVLVNRAQATGWLLPTAHAATPRSQAKAAVNLKVSPKSSVVAGLITESGVMLGEAMTQTGKVKNPQTAKGLLQKIDTQLAKQKKELQTIAESSAEPEVIEAVPVLVLQSTAHKGLVSRAEKLLEQPKFVAAFENRGFGFDPLLLDIDTDEISTENQYLLALYDDYEDDEDDDDLELKRAVAKLDPMPVAAVVETEMMADQSSLELRRASDLMMATGDFADEDFESSKMTMMAEPVAMMMSDEDLDPLLFDSAEDEDPSSLKLRRAGEEDFEEAITSSILLEQAGVFDPSAWAEGWYGKAWEEYEDDWDFAEDHDEWEDDAEEAYEEQTEAEEELAEAAEELVEAKDELETAAAELEILELSGASVDEIEEATEELDEATEELEEAVEEAEEASAELDETTEELREVLTEEEETELLESKIWDGADEENWEDEPNEDEAVEEDMDENVTDEEEAENELINEEEDFYPEDLEEIWVEYDVEIDPETFDEEWEDEYEAKVETDDLRLDEFEGDEDFEESEEGVEEDWEE